MSGTSALPAVTNGIMTFTIPLTIVVGVGTGSLWFAHAASGTGGSINRHSLMEMVRAQRVVLTISAPASAANDIDYIRKHLKLSTTELAKYLGVSRQAIYDWKAGSHVKSHNISKLENLRDAASILDASGLPFSFLQLNRKLAGGRTLLETVALGGNGFEAAHTLVVMLRREGEQRKAREAKIVGRQPMSDSEYDQGMAAIRESG